MTEYLRIANIQSRIAIGIDNDEFDSLQDDDHDGEDDISFIEDRLVEDC